jgi:hypothetical protein
MNAATVQIEAAQLGLVQRTQKYLDGAALKLIDGATGGGAQQPQASAEPVSRTPPVQPVSATPREGSSIHVVA